MKIVLPIAVMILCIFAGTISPLALWIQTNGPYGGGVNDFLVSGSVLFTKTAASL